MVFSFHVLLSCTAILSTVGFFLTGIPICITIARNRSTGARSHLPFLVAAVSCIFWLRYGILKYDVTIMAVNGIGLALEASYVAVYWFYHQRKMALNAQIASLGSLSCFMLLFVHFSEDVQSTINVLGMCCLFLNILSFAAPLATLKEVIASQSTKTLPFSLCLANFIVAVQWMTYGLLVEDIYISVPNFAGLILSVIQLSLFAIYPTEKKLHDSISGASLKQPFQTATIWLHSALTWVISLNIYISMATEEVLYSITQYIVHV